MRYAGIIVAVALAAGCTAKLKDERTFTLPDDGGADYKPLELDAQSRDQTIAIEFSSSSEPVDVFVVFAKDAAGFDNLSNDARAKKAAGSMRGATTGTLSVPVPAKTAYRVVVATSKPTAKKSEVKLKITN